MSLKDSIEIYGAKEHNLKNVDLVIPRNKLVVFTGLSGSGKSSLAFDTLFAEGQRRYIETFSSYARQFIGGMERPDVDKIDGLSPVISIEQKTVSKSPRSTVGTITELYDFLRLLFARVATAYSFETGEKMVRYSDDQLSELIKDSYKGEKIAILASKVRARKGHYRELFEQILKSGYTKVRVDGEIKEIVPGMKLDRYKVHDIEIVIDRFAVNDVDYKRIYDSVTNSFSIGDDFLMIYNYSNEEARKFSRKFICPTSGISYPDPEPNLFSFNSPYGACFQCSGIGTVKIADRKKVIPNLNKTIFEGGIEPLGKYKKNWIFQEIERLLEDTKYGLKTPINKLDEATISLLLNGSNSFDGLNQKATSFEGILPFLKRHSQNSSKKIERWAQGFTTTEVCPSCVGSRLKKEAQYFKINDRHIAELSTMGLDQLKDWLTDIEGHLSSTQQTIAKELLKEIRVRLDFIIDVGLGYLSLNRPSKSLSGGEAQRIRLATQIGTELINVCYIFDEPSIGLHQRDNKKLIKSLQKLKSNGNSVIVVEHDKEIMEAADFIVDIGPRAGVHGGTIVSKGDYKTMLSSNSLTAQYLNGQRTIEVPNKLRTGNGKTLELVGATGNNLKDVKIKIKLGTLTCISGVSGSGKSTLINQTLVPILFEHIYNGVRKPLPYTKVKGLEHLDKVVEIDQNPIGRTPRSNPATYTKIFDEVRQLFASLPEALVRGYKPGRFSFNVSGGKCETCNGGGMKLIEMNFLPDVHVECETCHGKRYNPETLQVKYKGKSISDVLNMTIEQAFDFFEAHPKTKQKIGTLLRVGLGYIKLGQSSTTLSGGEAQRIKLASELSKKSTGKTIYILDEPSTGLHFEDIKQLLAVLNALVDAGNTVLVIEHNLDIIKVADQIIDIGPEGGDLGGKIVFNGTPQQLVKKASNSSYTAKYLKKEL
ncbi:MAG: excinuclease ABC subunit UvrA [Crocinitomicaceae bacterium]